MAEVPVPSPEVTPTPTAAPTPATPGNPDRFERRYQQNIAGMQPPGSEAAGLGSFSQDKFAKQRNEADTLYGQLAGGEGGPVSTPTATPPELFENPTNNADALPTQAAAPSPFVEVTYQDKAKAAGLFEKPTNDADALSRFLERDQQVLAEISPEQRAALSRGLREMIKKKRGVGDSGDLPEGDQGMVRSIQNWLLGKIK